MFVVKRFARRQVLALLWAGAVALAAGSASAQVAVGTANVVVREVSATAGGAARTLASADPVHRDELIATATESATEITFDDQTQLSIGPESQVTLDEFIYDPNSHAGSLAIAVTVGVIRLASGDMNEEGVVITTPVATIGIRGTIVTVSVAADGTTTVSVEQGAADVSSASGGSQSVAAGLSTTVAPGAPPSPPSSPPPAALAAVTGMDNVLGTGLGTGVAAGEGGGAFGEITPLVPAAGALAVIGVVIAVTAGGGQPSSPTTTGTSGTAP